MIVYCLSKGKFSTFYTLSRIRRRGIALQELACWLTILVWSQFNEVHCSMNDVQAKVVRKPQTRSLSKDIAEWTQFNDDDVEEWDPN